MQVSLHKVIYFVMVMRQIIAPIFNCLQAFLKVYKKHLSRRGVLILLQHCCTFSNLGFTLPYCSTTENLS